MPLLNIPDLVYDALAMGYTKEALLRSMFPLASEFILKNQDLCLQNGVEQRFFEYASRKVPKKEEVVLACAVPFMNQVLFRRFRETLNPNLRTLLDDLVWSEELNTVEIQQRHQIDITNQVKNSWGNRTEIKPQYYFFKVKTGNNWYNASPQEMSLSLDPRLRETLMRYYDKPTTYNFIPLAEPPAAQYYFEGEMLIYQELGRVLVYHQQGSIKTNTKNEVALTTLSKMRRQVELTEFYGKEVLPIELRTFLLATLIQVDYKHKQTPNSTLAYLQSLFTLYRDYFDVGATLLHLKSKGATRRESIFNYKELMKELPINAWVTVDNMLDYVRYRQIDINPYNTNELYQRSYYSDGSGGYDRRYISSSNLQTSVVQPALRATLFLWAAAGWLDIAYNPPPQSSTASSNPNHQLYDGVVAVRLTHLGAYLLGKNEHYQPPKAYQLEPPSLSPTALHITTDPKDTTSDLLFAPYTTKIANNQYKTSYQIFLQGCDTKAVLAKKIQMFKNIFDDKVTFPDNWNTFIDTMQSRTKALTEIDPYKVLRLSPDHPELIKLMVQDPQLSNLVLKAEGHHIIVLEKNLPKIKLRLKEFGYILDI